MTDGGGGGGPPRKSIFFIVNGLRLQTQIPYRWLDANQTTFLWLVIVWSTRVKYLL